MDFVIGHVIDKLIKKNKVEQEPTSAPGTEMFGNTQKNDVDFDSDRELKKIDSSGILTKVVPFTIGIISAYLGWQCDTKKGKGLITKIFLALLYFSLGLLHIVFYFLVSRNSCR